MSKPNRTSPSFAALVQAYFAEYLTQQRALSPQTIAAYRDALVLFLQFAQSQLGKAPVAMTLLEITPDLITAFLNHLEQQRHNCVRSRNARLAHLCQPCPACRVFSMSWSFCAAGLVTTFAKPQSEDR
jgi:site-specific recombinase XerD